MWFYDTASATVQRGGVGDGFGGGAMKHHIGQLTHLDR